MNDIEPVEIHIKAVAAESDVRLLDLRDFKKAKGGHSVIIEQSDKGHWSLFLILSQTMESLLFSIKCIDDLLISRFLATERFGSVFLRV